VPVRLLVRLRIINSDVQYDINKYDINLKYKNARKKRTKALKISRAELPLARQMWFERTPEKHMPEKTGVGRKMSRKSG